ncbi:MAG: hypothetical protein AB1689_22450 [Thermodesulfobacteriota bacterium]
MRALALDAAHRRYLLIEQGVGAALFNLLLNAGIAWLMVRSVDAVPTWGRELSIVGDTIGTAFLLPFFTCLIVTRLARGQVEKGRLPRLDSANGSHAALRRLPAGTLPRALVLGLACVIAFAPVVVWALAALEVREMGAWRFVVFKGLFAAALAALVTPLVALRAICDAAASG